MEDQMSTSSGGAGSMPMTEQVKQQAGEVMGQAKETGSKLASQAKEQMKSSISGQKEQAAGSLESVAVALRQSVDSLRTSDQNGVAGMMETAAGAVENISNYLREHDIEDMGRQVEDFARRQPAAFLGGAFALGFLAARFLKSGGSAGGGDGSYTYSPGHQSGMEAGFYSGAPTGADAVYGAGPGTSPPAPYTRPSEAFEDVDETDRIETGSTYSS